MKVRPVVLLLPVTLLLAVGLLSLLPDNLLVSALGSTHRKLLDLFGPLYSVVVPAGLLLLIVIYHSPLGRLTIGGPQAEPVLSKPAWFLIVLCTTVAAGILFWATAEPVWHFNAPPDGSMEARSPAASSFAMSTLFLHWTFLPYSLYCVSGLMFAICYFNLGQPFHAGSTLRPILGERVTRRLSPWIDGVCLFSLTAGIAASMGSALLTLGGGFDRFMEGSDKSQVLGWMALLITLTMGVSAASGLLRGIKALSYINAFGFLVLILWVSAFAPWSILIPRTGIAVAEFVTTLLPRSLSIGMNQGWSENWTVFYWSNWLAWTPITAVFLGRLGRGYTVRTFIRFNLIYPSLFSVCWLSLFGGYALSIDEQSGELNRALQTDGPESVIFQVFDTMPLATISSLFFLLVVFLSFVTSGDSLVSAMSGLTTRDISERKEEAPAAIKFVWAGVIGLTSWFMVRYIGLDGIRIVSNLGGFPALVLYVMVLLGLIRLLWKRSSDLTDTGERPTADGT